jgi:hypothetical protein
MKQLNFSYLKWILLTAYIFLIFVYLEKVVRPELYFHLQQPAFLSNWNFFQEFYNYPGGIAQYIANFLSQLFFFGWAGSLVIIGVGILIMVSGFYILKSFKPSISNYFWMFVPFILLIALMNDYNFPFVVVIKMTIVFLALWLFTFILKRKINPFVPFILISPVLYYFDGSGYVLIFTITAILSFPFHSDSAKKSIYFLIFASFYNYLIDIVAFKYIFSIGPYDTYFSLLHDDLFVYLFYIPGFLFYAFCFSMPFILLLFFVKYKVLDNIIKSNWNINNKIFTYSLLIATIAGLSYYIIHSSIDIHRKNIILADYYCYNEKWADAIDVATSDPQYDMSINFNFNRAAANSGQLTKLFFSYPQYMGINALYPDKEHTHALSLTCSDYYFDLGYIKESEHWAAEGLIMHPYSLRILKRLVMTNLIMGNYNGARKYLSVLDDNLLASDFVKKYMGYVNDTALISKDTVIVEKRSYMPDSTYSIYNIVDRFNILIKRNDKNLRAFENRQMFYLLESRLDLFMNDLKESCKFYKNTPELYEQANLLYIITTKGKSIDQYNIGTNSQKTFMECFKILKEYNNNKELAKPALSNYSNSFLYYILYNSPMVTKIKITKEKILIDVI